MIISDYYKFCHLPGTKSKSRFDCVTCTKSYEPFEVLRNKLGDLFLYYTDVPVSFNNKVKSKADKCLSKSHSISSIFVPDITLPLAYGDVRGTLDGLLLVFNPDYTVMELFIARGQKNNKINLYNLLVDGELRYELQYFRGILENA
jgi:hypothetical protein